MPFEQNVLEMCCTHCFYNFTLDEQKIPNIRLLAVKLQIQNLGAEIECPRCKGNFVKREKASAAKARKTPAIQKQTSLETDLCSTAPQTI